MKPPPTGVDDRWIQYVIMDRPLDYPDDVIVVRWRIDREEPERVGKVWRFPSVDAARDLIMEMLPDAICYPRVPRDPSSIVETWW